MKNRLIWKILLICILGVAGWYLFDTLQYVESNSPELKMIRDYKNLVFISGAGIDVMGNNIDAMDVSGNVGVNKGASAFLLRSGTVNADMKFWNEVSNNLPASNEIRLIGYCEDSKCIEFIKNNLDKVNFTILEYGEVVDMQAVISADGADEFWLVEFGNREKVKWHDGSVSPLTIARRLNHEKTID
jgi:hypothetical protein